MTRWRSIADFLALRRNTSLLLVALVVAGTGEKLWLGFAPKYIETLGGGILVIGLFDALQTTTPCASSRRRSSAPSISLFAAVRDKRLPAPWHVVPNDRSIDPGSPAST